MMLLALQFPGEMTGYEREANQKFRPSTSDCARGLLSVWGSIAHRSHFVKCRISLNASLVMTSFREFQNELERLHQQAETARRREKGEALARIRELIVEYQLLPSDLGLVPATKSTVKAPAIVRFRDPETGATWSGRGRVPGWLKDRDRSKFAVD